MPEMIEEFKKIKVVAFKAKALDILMKYFEIACCDIDVFLDTNTMNLCIKSKDAYATGADTAIALVDLVDEKTKEDYRFLKEYIKLLKDNDSKVISRDDLYKEIDRIFGSTDKFLDIVEEDTPNCYISFKDEDEYVVIDTRAHRYISWYKHVGRDFDTDMQTKDEVISFLQRLHDNWKKEYEEEGKQ